MREETKIAFFLVSIVAAFAFSTAISQLFLALVLLSMLALAKFKNFRPFLFVLPFLAVADFGLWFFLQGTTIDLFQLTIVSNIRIFSLLLASSFFSFSTDVFALLKLMKRLRLPEFLYLPIFILFRFLPEVERDLLEISDLQKLRGISPRQPFTYLKSILLPLFYTLFQKSDELAIAYYLRKKQGRA